MLRTRGPIRRRLIELALVAAMAGLATLTAGYVLGHQRIGWPSWTPLVGEDTFTLVAEFQTAQAVAPGQGQTVTVAGVRVGDIARVDLHDGRARVTMQLEPEWKGRVKRDAELLLRPKTGLKDMTVAMDPGSARSPALPNGATLPIASTLPDVNVDEVLSVLDHDTRAYLQLLVNGLGDALRGNDRQLAATLKRLNPTARDLKRINGGLASRQRLLRRAVHDFRLVAEAVGAKDEQLARLVDSSNDVLGAFARSERQVRDTLQQLPGALTATRDGMTATTDFAESLERATEALAPTARELGPGLRATRPLLRESTPLIENDLRPFARESKPVLDALRPAAADLKPITQDLGTSFSALGELLNELAFQPGQGRESFLFYLAWLDHNLNSTFNVKDAHGVQRRGILLTDCNSRTILDAAAQANATVRLLLGLLTPPPAAQLCGGGR
jgi:phospholipid/cholesterol/gamma-HCH transport system substrate-binding protein